MEEFSFNEFKRNHIDSHPLFKKKASRIFAILEAGNDEFDFTPYEKKFLILKEEGLQPGSMGFTYRSYIKNLIREERIGTAVSYHCSYVSLKRFRGNVRFTAITPSFLRQYEIAMLKENTSQRKLSRTTIGIYLRGLRAIFNETVADKAVKADAYPFRKRKYQIPGGRNVKKGLTVDHIAALFNYLPTCYSEQ